MYPTSRAPIHACCDQCSWRGVFDTRTEAFEAMDAHELETTHFNLLWRHMNGWRRFNPPSWIFGGARHVTDNGRLV